MARAWLSLGSNIQPRQHLAAALAELRARFGTLAESPWYRTRAVGFDGPDFFNLTVEMESDLGPLELAAWLHDVEAQHGRDRTQPRFANRTLDIDIVLYDDLVMEGSGPVRIPRDELGHAFVLRPLSDLVPDLVPPDGDPRTLSQRWCDLPEQERASVALVPAQKP
ncbi:MAG: 2-amino-4-hydroxy-6-hydroxymethyldihydropteridine diphosphokinase [Lysobacterales bacterium]